MGRFTISVLIFMIILLIMPVQFLSEDAGTSSAQSDIKVIPDEAIRLRILANSDKPDDQELKRKVREDRKSTRLNSSHVSISYAVFCLKKKKKRSEIHILKQK